MINSVRQNLPVEMHKPKAQSTQCQLPHMLLKTKLVQHNILSLKVFQWGLSMASLYDNETPRQYGSRARNGTRLKPAKFTKYNNSEIFKLLLYLNFDYNKIWFKRILWKKVSNNKVSHSHNLLKANICPQGYTRQRPENYELGRDTLPQLS
jgi:hypothetical protein